MQASDNQGVIPLMFAVQSVERFLTELNAATKEQKARDFKLNRDQVVNILFNIGSSCNIKDQQGHNLLYYATQHPNNEKMVIFLNVEFGCDFDVLSEQGKYHYLKLIPNRDSTNICDHHDNREIIRYFNC